MSTQVFVAKYVPDPARWEPRNIGVIVRTSQGSAARFLGEPAQSTGGAVAIDGRSVRFAVGAPLDLYRDWVRYWRTKLVDEPGDPTELPPVEGSTFLLVKAGDVWRDDRDVQPGRLVSEYFSRLVHHVDDAPVEELRERVESLLLEAEVATRPSFRRDVAVRSQGLSRQELYRFAYGYQNGHLVVGHRVPLGQEPYVHDALWRYRNISDEILKVTFVQGLEANADTPAVGLLQDVSTVIDVTHHDAEERTIMAFLGDG